MNDNLFIKKSSEDVSGVILFTSLTLMRKSI